MMDIDDAKWVIDKIKDELETSHSYIDGIRKNYKQRLIIDTVIIALIITLITILGFKSIPDMEKRVIAVLENKIHNKLNEKIESSREQDIIKLTKSIKIWLKEGMDPDFESTAPRDQRIISLKTGELIREYIEKQNSEHIAYRVKLLEDINNNINEPSEPYGYIKTQQIITDNNLEFLTMISPIIDDLINNYSEFKHVGNIGFWLIYKSVKYLEGYFQDEVLKKVVPKILELKKVYSKIADQKKQKEIDKAYSLIQHEIEKIKRNKTTNEQLNK